MSFQVQLARRAERDIEKMYSWLSERSASGANRWYNQFLKLLDSLQFNPELYGLADEAGELSIPLRQALFKTRKGRTYRALFTIEESTVHILAVRGPAQRPVAEDDLDL
jgi:plasmid stabilization system protein ParE